MQRRHLLCVSFDPEHDTPERLRAYGATYIGSDAKSAFATGTLPCRRSRAAGDGQFFDLGMTNEADSTITHTLSTTLIGPGRQGGALLSRQRVDGGAIDCGAFASGWVGLKAPI
jgi:cytochrome oxidase Cu insertion factor (SCO1/SenC/PrrC family)